MPGLAAKAILAGVITTAWFVPYIRFVRQHLHPTVDGGITGGVLVVTVALSSTLALRLQWSPTWMDSVEEFAVPGAVVLLTSVLLDGAGTYFGWAGKRRDT